MQFGLLAGLNKWREQEKAAYLATSLRGSALTVLTNLPEEQRSDYGGLCAALENRFGNTRQVKLNRARLCSRIKRREESLSESAKDIERLTRLAYPDAAESMIAVLEKDQFIDSLLEEDMRLRIWQSAWKFVAGLGSSTGIGIVRGSKQKQACEGGVSGRSGKRSRGVP